MSDEDRQKFLDWCKSNGVDFDGLEVRSAGEDAGNGVFASHSFRVESKLISLPSSLMLIASKIVEMPKYSKLIEDAKFFPTPFEMLTTFFYLEDSDNSEYGPYLKMLPQSFDTPIYKKKTVDPTHLPLSVRHFWQTQQDELKNIRERLRILISDLNEERLLWAWHVVNTRCIYVENKPHTKIDCSQGDTLAVIPFVDMLNHDPEAQGFAMLDKYSNNYIVKATRFVHEDSQLYVCYGPHDNARLWMEYGFIMDKNPNVKVVISQDLLVALAKKVGVNVTPSHEISLGEANLPSHIYLSDEGASWALRTNIKILLMSSQQIQNWRDIVYADKIRRFSRRRSSASSSSSSESESIDSPEEATLKKILEELKANVEAKCCSISEELRWMWKEQLDLINMAIQNV